VKAILAVPEALSVDSLREVLESLAAEMMVDIALDEHGAG
jgi:glycine cleavage system regulatory protein